MNDNDRAAAWPPISSTAASGEADQAASLDIETQGFIDSIAGGKPLHMLSPGEAREVLSAVQELVEIDLAPAHVEDLELEVGPTGVTRVRIYRPVGALRQGLHRL